MAPSHQAEAMGVVVDIGGLAVGLRGLGPLEVPVRRRYARFLTVDVAPRLVLDLTVIEGEGAHRPDGAPAVERDGAGYRVRWGALSAELDLAAGRGRAEVLETVYLVDSLLRIAVTLLAVEDEALLLHASGVLLDDGRVLVAFGPSGVGKTTVARSVPSARVLCDEMILLSAEGERVRAAGTPFHGDLDVCAPLHGEVAALVRLRHAPADEADRLEALSPARGARELLGSVLFFSPDEALADRLLGLALRLCGRCTYTLTFRRTTHVPTHLDQHLRRHAPASGGAPARA
jgi:hypothetical protein